ncbi:L-type lectin-domain containing receptor kinase IX.1-like [Camellia sinensis]|uniref:L-type lectin-domain containing receptor kinase IX.1-like n=1 Tax=Camellia sinensis TaxID=4442 RepID=UPI00103555E3|nr:L-type lectin-domain containing receptor kinase IX.1-like [Camellia sinensis]
MDLEDSLSHSFLAKQKLTNYKKERNKTIKKNNKKINTIQVKRIAASLMGSTQPNHVNKRGKNIRVEVDYDEYIPSDHRDDTDDESFKSVDDESSLIGQKHEIQAQKEEIQAQSNVVAKMNETREEHLKMTSSVMEFLKKQGININSLKSNATTIWYNNIIYGKDNEAWISYDSRSKNLSVVFTGYISNTRVKSVLSWPIDLRDYLSEWVTIGFSAAIGAVSEKHTIKLWSFNSSSKIDAPTSPSPNPNPNPNPNPIPSPNLSPSLSNKKPVVVGLTVGSFGLVCGLSLFMFVLWMKWTNEEVAFNMSIDNDFEVGIGPKKFSHSELFHVTNKFADIIGQGGFGEVYRGFLKESKSNVVVKRILKGPKQDIREYASEVKIISRLRHRNLVQLLGWCHEKGELLLVYDLIGKWKLR